MKHLSNHVHVKMGSSSLWLARHLDGHAGIDVLSDPDPLFSISECEIIKDQRKIKVGRVPLEIGGEIKRVYLKRYNAFSWRYRLGSFFARSAAVRSAAGAETLKEAGFCTGEPMAAVEVRSWGMLTKSFYLAEEISDGKTADAYWREELLPIARPEGFRRRRRFLKGLAELFRSLHDSNIYHNDLKDANILVRCVDEHQGESFCLLDLEGIWRCRHLNGRRRIKNVVQLNRTMGKLLRRTEKLYWLKAYMGNLFFDRGPKRRWIKRVLAGSARGDRRSLRKG